MCTTIVCACVLCHDMFLKGLLAHTQLGVTVESIHWNTNLDGQGQMILEWYFIIRLLPSIHPSFFYAILFMVSGGLMQIPDDLRWGVVLVRCILYENHKWTFTWVAFCHLQGAQSPSHWLHSPTDEARSGAIGGSVSCSRTLRHGHRGRGLNPQALGGETAALPLSHAAQTQNWLPEEDIIMWKQFDSILR